MLADNIAVGWLTLASPHGRITHGPVLHWLYPTDGSIEVRPSPRLSTYRSTASRAHVLPTKTPTMPDNMR
ncbi:hypothetical protein, partial [Mesorhizobium sp. M8A.F.Ca.ET.142.01.1.1]|uniref:hypothetical protein n=1 Tax=Mesorhizobium sp. M8A.F.Ca.ET.142.01.1.1 TaxID=2563958 RepID=UPI001AEE281E